MEDKLNITGFLYRAMVERDPSKRRVKPVEKNLQLLDFGDLGDSSDDSDFEIGEQDLKDDSNDDSGDSNKEESDDDDDSEEEEKKIKKEPKLELHDVMKELPVEENAVEQPQELLPEGKVEGEEKVPKLSVGQLIERAMHRQSQARQRISAGMISKKLKILVCCVCLGDISEEDDEIVECDCCGITVHEGCYGINDCESADSSASSSSTEPWFCDACKAGNMEPICELCPNPGGIFKETDVGRWVHLVCALYIPGVAFGNVDKLSPVTLFEMPYSKWGAKSCSLCEDEKYTRTGVSICCDAGMCRSYFHITCAQREGLLSEASAEEDIADPFFAYCKLHADKGIVRSKRCNWLALQSQSRNHKLDSMPPSDEKARVERKLAWHRERYQNHRAQRPPAWVPTQKMPRMLTSSPTAYRRLIKKAELLGMSPHTHIHSSDTIVNIRKKWHVPAAFSVEFISYYLDRNTRMVSMQKHLDDLLQQNSQLQEQEQTVRTRYDMLINELGDLRNCGASLQDIGMDFWKKLCDMANKKLNIPEVLLAKRTSKSPNSKNSRKLDLSASVISECGICLKSHDQHQLAKCDKCTLHYHLACLDPPLSRMPKKTKSQGWQCSECDKTEEDIRNERIVDPNAPRRLRDHTGKATFVDEPGKLPARRGRPPRKTTESRMSRSSSTEVESVDTQATPEDEVTGPREKLTLTIRRGKRKARELNLYRQRSRGRRGKKRKLPETVLQAEMAAADEWAGKQEASDAGTPTPSTAQHSPQPSTTGSPPHKTSRQLPPRKARADLRTECCRCGETGDNNNLVRCDECKKCYHFSCLRPPVKKSPKQRGYTWHCEECDSSSEEGEETNFAVKYDEEESPVKTMQESE